jgi:IS5 family transposase
VIGHLKAKGHLGRRSLKGRTGDAANATLSTVGYSFRGILARLRLFCAYSLCVLALPD